MLRKEFALSEPPPDTLPPTAKAWVFSPFSSDFPECGSASWSWTDWVFLRVLPPGPLACFVWDSSCLGDAGLRGKRPALPALALFLSWHGYSGSTDRLLSHSEGVPGGSPHFLPWFNFLFSVDGGGFPAPYLFLPTRPGLGRRKGLSFPSFLR